MLMFLDMWTLSLMLRRSLLNRGRMKLNLKPATMELNIVQQLNYKKEL